MDAFKKHIIKILEEQGIKDAQLETPPNPQLGDYAYPCFSLAKEQKKAPPIIAKEISQKILPDDQIEQITATGPYINFYIKKESLLKKALEIPKSTKQNKTIVIDFSAPNIAKPFTIAHLRSTGIGAALYKTYEHAGYNVVGVNHLGDWGTQFGKLICAYKKWGDHKKLEENPIKYLLEIYVKFHDEAEKNPELENEGREEFKKLEQKNPENLELWKEFKDLSLVEFKKTYKRLNVKFDSWNGESFYEPLTAETLKSLESKNLLTESEGAKIVNLDKYKLTPFIIIKSDGTTIYGTRDVAAVQYRFKEYNPEKIIYVVDVRQSEHFKQLFQTAELLGYDKNKLEHAQFGLLNLPEGTMSTRKGRVIFLEDVLDKSVELVKKIIDEKNPDLKNKEQVAEMVGIGAIQFLNLKTDRIIDINFKWEDALNFEGESGPYLQYTHARICSILRKSEVKLGEDLDYQQLITKLNTKDDLIVINQLNQFPTIIEQVINTNKPHYIARWLLDLAQQFNTYYANNRVIQEDKELEQARILLLTSIKKHLAHGLDILGIKSPEEM